MSDIKLNETGESTRLAVVSSAQKTQTTSSSAAPAKIDKLESQLKVQQEQQEKTQKLSIEDVKNAVTKLNDFIQTVQRNLQFNLDDASGKTIITVVDKQTSEVVRQIPDDVAIKLAQDLQQSEPLSLFNAKV
ncbi:MAG: flagellar protein FlaG [Oleiphilaceae bacterium]|jgi:flagellar protein FlaG